MNKTMKRLLSLSICVLLLVTMVTACGKKDDNSATELTGCTITVQSEGGSTLANVGVSVYADTNKTDLLDFVRTNNEGVASLTATVKSGNAYVFLTDIPDGYAAEEYYTITEQNTVISLTAQMSGEMSKIELGKVMFDFTVTDQNGTSHTLSKLLESKKASWNGTWKTFREMPWGEMYIKPYTGRVLTRAAYTFSFKLAAFSSACEKMGAQKLPHGDASYQFELIPGFFIQILIWQGDEEFPPNAQVIYSDNFAEGFAAEDRVVAGDILISTIKANM